MKWFASHWLATIILKIPGTIRKDSVGEHPRIDHRKAVKKYHRPAAGNETPLPEDVRPPKVLAGTMEYLLADILDRSSAPFSEKHMFVRDRTRSIRQDIIVQQRAIHRDPESLLVVVRLHEQIARFHILSAHRLCGSDFADFNPFQNTEQLRKVLQSLQEYYTDIRGGMLAGGPDHPCLHQALEKEPEFRGYQLLAHGQDQDVFRQALSFPKQVFSSAQVQFSLRALSALHQVDYVKFFNLVRRSDYLQACLLHTLFPVFRKSSLAVISKAFGTKEPLSVSLIARWLLVEEHVELVTLLESLDYSVQHDGSGDALVHFYTISTVNVDVGASPALKSLPLRFIEEKSAGWPMSQIIKSSPPGANPDPGPDLPLSHPRIAPAAIVVASKPLAPVKKPLVQDSALIKQEISRAIVENLIHWLIRVELSLLCQQSIATERERRAIIKSTTLSTLARLLLDGILGELAVETERIALAEAERDWTLQQYRRRAVEQLAKAVAEELLGQVVAEEGLRISKAIKPLTLAKKASTPPAARYLAARSFEQTLEAFMRPSHGHLPLDEENANREKEGVTEGQIKCHIMRVLFNAGRVLDEELLVQSRFCTRLSNLTKRASMERLETERLEEMLQRAINS